MLSPCALGVNGPGSRQTHLLHTGSGHVESFTLRSRYSPSPRSFISGRTVIFKPNFIQFNVFCRVIHIIHCRAFLYKEGNIPNPRPRFHSRISLSAHLYLFILRIFLNITRNNVTTKIKRTIYTLHNLPTPRVNYNNPTRELWEKEKKGIFNI